MCSLTLPPVSDILSSHMMKENTASIASLPLSSFFGRNNLLFVRLPSDFDSKLITSWDSVICSLWCTQEAFVPPRAFAGSLYCIIASRNLQQVGIRTQPTFVVESRSLYTSTLSFDCYLILLRAAVTSLALHLQ